MFTAGGRRGACAFFLTGSERTSPRIVSLLRVLLPSISISLFFLPLFPRFLTAARSQSVLPDFHQIGPLRDMFRCIRSGTSARVAPLACPYLLSYGSRRCKRIDASTAVRCGRRLMSPRQSRARVCHVDSIRHGSQRISHVSPFSAPIFLSFNRLLRILSLDRADIASETCTYAPLSPCDRISQLIHLRTMPLVIWLTIDLETYQTNSYQIEEKVDRFM